jgi:hypothetical protein
MMQKLPHWAQDVAVSRALDAMREDSDFGSQASFQSHLENTLDVVFCDSYVFAQIGGHVGIIPAEYVESDSQPSMGVITVESGHRQPTDSELRWLDR